MRQLLAFLVVLAAGALPATIIAQLPAFGLAVGFVGLAEGEVAGGASWLVWCGAAFVGLLALWISAFRVRFTRVSRWVMAGCLVAGIAAMLPVVHNSWSGIVREARDLDFSLFTYLVLGPLLTGVVQVIRVLTSRSPDDGPPVAADWKPENLAKEISRTPADRSF